MVSHLDPLWNRGTRELGNGLFLSVGGIVFGGQKFTPGPAVRAFNKYFFHSRYLQNGTAVLDNSLAFLVRHSVKVALIAEE